MKRQIVLSVLLLLLLVAAFWHAGSVAVGPDASWELVLVVLVLSASLARTVRGLGR